MFGAVRKRLEHVLYDDFDSGKRDFLKKTVYLGSLVLGVEGVSGCVGRDTRVTPAPTLAPHVQFFRDFPELSYGFTRADEEWARNYLDVLGEEWFSSHPEFHETLNAKIRQERLILSEKLGQSFSAVPDIVGSNWDYHLKLDEEGKSLFHLDAGRMRENFPNREDREIIYRGMWMPIDAAEFDALTGQSSRFSSENQMYPLDGKPHMEILKKNLDAIFDGTIYKRIVENYKFDPEREINWKNRSPESSLYDGARSSYDYEFFLDRPGWGWIKTGEAFKKIDEKLRQDEKMDKLRFTYGFINWINALEKIHEVVNPYQNIIFAKAIGATAFVVSGAPADGAHVSEPIFPTPEYLMKEFRSKPEIYGTLIPYKGSGIGYPPTIEAYEADGTETLIPYWDESKRDYVKRVVRGPTYPLKQSLPTGEIVEVWRKS